MSASKEREAGVGEPAGQHWPSVPPPKYEEGPSAGYAMQPQGHLQGPPPQMMSPYAGQQQAPNITVVAPPPTIINNSPAAAAAPVIVNNVVGGGVACRHCGPATMVEIRRENTCMTHCCCLLLLLLPPCCFLPYCCNWCQKNVYRCGRCGKKV